MIYYILMVDSRCVKVNEPNLSLGYDSASEKLGYENFSEFHDDLNMVEWKDDGKKFLKNYKTMEVEITDAESDYYLESFISFKKTKKPTRQLAEEFDDID